MLTPPCRFTAKALAAVPSGALQCGCYGRTHAHLWGDLARQPPPGNSFAVTSWRLRSGQPHGEKEKGYRDKNISGPHVQPGVALFSSLTSYIETDLSVATEIDLTQPDTFQARVLSKAHRQQVAEEIPPSVCQGGEGCPSPAVEVHGEMSKWYLFDFIYKTLNP